MDWAWADQRRRHDNGVWLQASLLYGVLSDTAGIADPEQRPEQDRVYGVQVWL